MILKALYDYYKRMESKLPSYGTEMKEIHYIVIIDKNGKFLRFESKRIDKKQAAQFCVPIAFKRSGKNPPPYILWDKGKYVFGFYESENDSHQKFIAIVNKIAENHKDDVSIQALKNFYSHKASTIQKTLTSDKMWNEIEKNYNICNFSFQLEGDYKIIAEKQELFEDYISKELDTEELVYGRCLISGERGLLTRLSKATPIPDTQANASLVSFQKSSGFDSYGKTQCYNAPISKNIEFKYSIALNTMLNKDSRNKFLLGKRTYLFWGSKSSDSISEAEALFFDFLNMDFNKEDNPNDNIVKVEKFFKSIWSGEIKTDLDDKFFILILAPNIGRIAVVYFEETSLKDFAGKLLRHFEDMNIVDSRSKDKQRPFCGLFSILSAVTLGGKASDASPNLPEAVMSAMLNGTTYPYQLLTAAIQRICAESNVSVARAAIIKAYINRISKYNSNKLKKMLDKTNDNCGYICGRLTAVLEKIQTDAKSGDSIKSRYMTAASATPSAVFPSMLNLSMHHMDKLTEGSKIYYEKLKQEILEKISADGFPPHLDLADQGRFFVGYYHQRADLYSSNKNDN